MRFRLVSGYLLLVITFGLSWAIVSSTGSAAVSHSAVAQSGQLYAFGLNDYGQLGNASNSGTSMANPTPELVSLPGENGPVTQIAGGGFHTLALTSSGQVYAFGFNVSGELGNSTNNGNSNPNPAPTLVSLPGESGPATQIAAGGVQNGSDSLVLTSSGQLYAFGDNYYGQLGSPTNNGNHFVANPTPTLVSLPSGSGQITQIAAGGSDTLVLTSSGQLYAFGDNTFGQLGIAANSGTSKPNPTPTLVSLPGQTGQITQIAAGGSHSLVLTSTGQLYAFGLNDVGQLGNPTNNGMANPNPTPTLVSLPSGSGQVTQIAAGLSHTLVLASSGQLYAFGYNASGQLGSTTNSGTSMANPTPLPVSLPAGSGHVTQIAADGAHSLVLTSDGQLYAFGDNYAGELGNMTDSGTTAANPTPLLVSLTVPPGMFIDALSFGPGAQHTLVALAPEPTLTVSLAGAGTGTVSGAGISCPATCSSFYTPDTTVTLTAAPAAGSAFAGWGGACAGTGSCNVRMSSSQSVSATFNAIAPPVVPAARISSARIDRKLHRATFKFTGLSATGFQCALIMSSTHKHPRSHFGSCNSPKTYRNLKAGRYLFELRALSAAGAGPVTKRRFTI
jgi:alpha-tubulin suppressor-like RCC1 family protein